MLPVGVGRMFSASFPAVLTMPPVLGNFPSFFQNILPLIHNENLLGNTVKMLYQFDNKPVYFLRYILLRQ